MFLKESDRVIWYDEGKDSTVVLVSTGQVIITFQRILYHSSQLSDDMGVEVGWLGYPAIAQHTLSFFSGNVSAWQEYRNAYLIDGVAINGVSGGPVLFSTTADGVQIVGSISAYRASRAAGESLPGLSLQKLDLAMENQQLTAIEFLAHVTAREAAVGRYKLMRDVGTDSFVRLSKPSSKKTGSGKRHSYNLNPASFYRVLREC